MNNNMYLYFDSNGYLKEFITCPARAGSENVNSIYFYVEPALESDRDKIDGNGDAYYALPNNVHHGTLDFKLPEVIQGVTDADDNLLIPLTFTSSNYVITDIQPFDKKRDLLFFKWFQKYQFVKVDLTASILLNSGNVLCTIGCYNSENTKVYNLDLFSFYVADNAVLKAVYITTSQYHELLTMFDEAKSMFDIEKRIVVLDDISVPNVIDGYEDDQLIYDKATSLYYVVNSSSEDGYEPANVNGLLGNKGALIRIFDLTDSITLQQIYNLIGANRYGALNVDGKEYLVIMNANNSIKAYDLLEKKLYDYIDAPEDTFAGVLDEIPTTFVEHTQQTNRVYGTNRFAQETTILYSANVVNNGIVQRDATGQINVLTTPAYAYNAASKDYVDSNYSKKVQLTIDNDTFVLTVNLLNNNNSIISTASVDLPLESIVVSAQYYETYTYEGTTYTKVLVIELATTDTPIIVPVGDLVSGLVSEATFNDAVAQLQTNINACVQQVNTQNIVYGTNNVGTQATLEYGASASSNIIVQRDSNGQIIVPTMPNANNKATSKQYVDTFGRTLEFSIDNTTYVMTFRLKDNNGNIISTQTIDLPLETMVVDGYYDSENENLVLELKNGNEITIPISDLISGLVTETSLATTLQSYYTKSQIDQMVSGFVFADVDDYLSDSSTNPVENRVITEELEKKANTQDLLDGQIVPNEALQAKSIKPVSQESGSIQSEPFVYQGSGTNNGSDIVDTSPVAKQLEKQGNSVVVNQKIKNGTFSDTSEWLAEANVSLSISNNTAHVVSTTANYGIYQANYNYKKDHKYLYHAELKSSTQLTIRVGSGFGQFTADLAIIALDTFVTFNSIATGNRDSISAFYFFSITSGGGTFDIRNVFTVDLTQWFGSNDAIPQDLLDHPSNFFRYYNGSLAYNTGTLVDSDGQYLECGQSRNVWDEEWEVGSVDSDGTLTNNPTSIRSKNFIPVIPNTEYYKTIVGNGFNVHILFYDINKNFISRDTNGFSKSKAFTTPSNCAFIMFSTYSSDNVTTYNNDITISLYYTPQQGGEGYDQYYPYIAPKVYDTGNEVLRKAGSVKDYKTPDGTIHRLVGVVDLGTLNWVRSANDNGYMFVCASNSIEDMKINNNYDTVLSNFLCSKYVAKVYGDVYYGRGDKIISPYENQKRVAIIDNSYTDAVTFKTAMSGVYLFYELATPTTEQGTPFAENIEINDYSYMAWKNADGYVEVPQGCKVFYPADYVLFIDSLYSRSKDGGESADVNNFVLQSERTADKTAQATLDSQLKEALGGTLRQLLATSKNIDFLNTAWVDLGELNWRLGGDSHTFIVTIPNAKATAYDVNNAISTSYDNKGEAAYTQYTTYGNMTFGHESSSQNFYFANANYTDATTFKNAMKGVLLAYEKAS